MIDRDDGAVEAISAAWWRRPGIPAALVEGLADEPREFAVQEWTAFVQGAVRLFDCHWVSHPDAVRAAGFKLVQLQRAAAAGFEVPTTYAGTSAGDVGKLIERHGPVIGKLVGHGTPRVRPPNFAYAVYASRFAQAPDSSALRAAPAIFQDEIERGRDLRVAIVGTAAFAASVEAPGTGADWRRCDPAELTIRSVELPTAVAIRCVELTRSFGLRFAAMDLIERPDGRHVFLELNPNGQWGWVQAATGQPIAEALAAELAR